MDQLISIFVKLLRSLSADPQLSHLLPLDKEGKELYDKVKDGILLWSVSIMSILSLISYWQFNKLITVIST